MTSGSLRDFGSDVSLVEVLDLLIGFSVYIKSVHVSIYIWSFLAIF